MPSSGRASPLAMRASACLRHGLRLLRRSQHIGIEIARGLDRREMRVGASSRRKYSLLRKASRAPASVREVKSTCVIRPRSALVQYRRRPRRTAMHGLRDPCRLGARSAPCGRGARDRPRATRSASSHSSHITCLRAHAGERAGWRRRLGTGSQEKPLPLLDESPLASAFSWHSHPRPPCWPGVEVGLIHDLFFAHHAHAASPALPVIPPPWAPRNSALGRRRVATMSSAMPPSVTTSSRFFIAIGVTEVIGSTPVDIDLGELLDPGQNGVELALGDARLRPQRPQSAPNARYGGRSSASTDMKTSNCGSIGRPTAYSRAPVSGRNRRATRASMAPIARRAGRRY